MSYVMLLNIFCACACMIHLTINRNLPTTSFPLSCQYWSRSLVSTILRHIPETFLQLYTILGCHYMAAVYSDGVCIMGTYIGQDSTWS